MKRRQQTPPTGHQMKVQPFQSLQVKEQPFQRPITDQAVFGSVFKPGQLKAYAENPSKSNSFSLKNG